MTGCGEQEESADMVRELRPGRSWFHFEWGEVWRYKHLLYFLAKRDLALTYKQTLLGPLHLVIRPFVMTFLFQLVFNKLGGISTDGIPSFLFYFANNTAWAFFAAVFGSVSSVFMSGKGLMGKVYFPRMIPPFASVITSAVSLGVQIVFLGCLILYFFFAHGAALPSWKVLGMVLPLVQLALIASGMGFIFACATLKYRDLSGLSGVVTQGLMYLSPVIFPLAVVPESYRMLAALNPLTSAMETWRYCLFGEATLTAPLLWVGWGLSFGLFFSGLVIFNKVQRKFMDIV